MIEDLGVVVDSLALIIVAALVVFLMRQTREISSQTRELTAQSKMLTEQLMIDSALGLQTCLNAIDQAALAYPETRQYFYEDEGAPPPPDGDTRSRVMTVAAMWADLLSIHFVAPETPVLQEVLSWYAAYVRDAFDNSQVLTDYVRMRSTWYHPDLVALANEAYARRHATQAEGEPGQSATSPD